MNTGKSDYLTPSNLSENESPFSVVPPLASGSGLSGFPGVGVTASYPEVASSAVLELPSLELFSEPFPPLDYPSLLVVSFPPLVLSSAGISAVFYV